MPDLSDSPVGGGDVGASSEGGGGRVMALQAQQGSGADPDQAYARQAGIKCLAPVTPNMKATNERWVLFNKEAFQQIFNHALYEMTKTPRDGCQDEPPSPTEAAPASVNLNHASEMDYEGQDGSLSEVRGATRKAEGHAGVGTLPHESGALTDITNEPHHHHPHGALPGRTPPCLPPPPPPAEPLDLSYKRSDDDVSSGSEGSPRCPSPTDSSSSNNSSSSGSGPGSPGPQTRGAPMRPDKWPTLTQAPDLEVGGGRSPCSSPQSRPSSRTSDTSDCRETDSPPVRCGLRKQQLSGQPWVAFNKKGIIDMVDSAMRDTNPALEKGHCPTEGRPHGHVTQTGGLNQRINPGRQRQSSPGRPRDGVVNCGHSMPSWKGEDIARNMARAAPKRPKSGSQEPGEAGGKKRKSRQGTPVSSPCSSPKPAQGAGPKCEGRVGSPGTLEGALKSRSPALLQVERFVRERAGRASSPRSQPQGVASPSPPPTHTDAMPDTTTPRPGLRAGTPVWVAVSKAEVTDIIDSVVDSMMAEDESTPASSCCRRPAPPCHIVPSPPGGAKTTPAAADDSSNNNNQINAHDPSESNPGRTGSCSPGSAGPPSSLSSSSSSSPAREQSGPEDGATIRDNDSANVTDTSRTHSGHLHSSDSARSPDACLKKAFKWKKSLLERVHEQAEASPPRSPSPCSPTLKPAAKNSRKSGQNSRKLAVPVRSK